MAKSLIPRGREVHEIYKEPPLISYRKGKSLKDMLVKAKTIKAFINTSRTPSAPRDGNAHISTDVSIEYSSED